MENPTEPQPEAGHGKRSRLRGLLAVAALAGWMYVGHWLKTTLDWPVSYGFPYGFQYCGGPGRSDSCYGKETAASHLLLSEGHGSLLEVALFVWICRLPYW